MSENKNQTFLDQVGIKDGSQPATVSGEGQLWSDGDPNWLDGSGANTNLITAAGSPTGNANFPWPEYTGHRISHVSCQFIGTPQSTPTDDGISYVPINIVRKQTFNRIGVRVFTASTGGFDLRLAIYDVSTDGTPGSLIVDAGTINLTSVGEVEATISQELQGKYYLAVAAKYISGVNPQVAIVNPTNLKGPQFFGFGTTSETSYDIYGYGVATGGISVVNTGFPGSPASTPTIFGVSSQVSAYIRVV